MKEKYIKLKLATLLFFVSLVAIGQNKKNDLTQALEKGTPSQVLILIDKGIALENTEEYLYKATLNSNIDYVKQNYKLLLKKGYKLAEYEYLHTMYKAIEKTTPHYLSF